VVEQVETAGTATVPDLEVELVFLEKELVEPEVMQVPVTATEVLEAQVEQMEPTEMQLVVASGETTEEVVDLLITAFQVNLESEVMVL
jgi:hypothetical protein